MTATATDPRAGAADLGLHHVRGPRLRVLHADAGGAFVAAGLDLYRTRDGGATLEPVARAGGAVERALARTPLASRLLRAGFHDLVPLPGGDLVAVVRGAVLHRAPGAGRFEVAHRVTRGTRPLNVCLAPSGTLFFGEYFGNAGRAEVHVYASRDGRDWHVAHTFPAGSIRHVHGVHADQHRGGVWVLTGDDDRESGIFWSGDDMATLEPVVRGTQRARAVALVAAPDGVVVPTDTPRERNLLQWLDPATGALEPLRELPGSVFTAGRAADLMLVSTTVEKSDVNTDQRSALLASRDGRNWRVVERVARDLAVLRDRRGYLQLPTIRIPSGPGGRDVLATGQALAGAHGRLLRWDGDALRAGLARPIET